MAIWGRFRSVLRLKLDLLRGFNRAAFWMRNGRRRKSCSNGDYYLKLHRVICRRRLRSLGGKKRKSVRQKNLERCVEDKAGEGGGNGEWHEEEVGKRLRV